MAVPDTQTPTAARNRRKRGAAIVILASLVFVGVIGFSTAQIFNPSNIPNAESGNSATSGKPSDDGHDSNVSSPAEGETDDKPDNGANSDASNAKSDATDNPQQLSDPRESSGLNESTDNSRPQATDEPQNEAGIGTNNSTATAVRLDVPTRTSESDYGCVPAALQSVLNYKGISVSQSQLATEMNTKPVTGTEYVDLAQVANKYLFGVEDPNPQGAGYHVQTIAIGDTSDATRQRFVERVKRDIASNDPVFVAIDAAALYPGVATGNHMVVVTGYDADEHGTITRYRYVESIPSLQDATYAGLRIATADEMMHAIVTNEEPAYIW